MPHNHNGQKWIRNDKRCAVYARDHFACVYCLTTSAKFCLDHVDPDAGNHEDNLVTCCWDCNADKGVDTLAEWFERRVARGEDPEDVRAIKQRVALQTFLPITRSLGKTLNRSRKKGGFDLLPVYERLFRRKIARCQHATHAFAMC